MVIVAILLLRVLSLSFISGFEDVIQTRNFNSQVKHFINSIMDIPQHLWNYLFHLEPEVTMNTTELIFYSGYNAETHKVITQDGYILKMFQISPRNGKLINSVKLPILFLHGTPAPTDVWLLNPPNNSLVYMLADAGYDIWLASFRGSEHGIGHTTLNINSDEFWEFSLEEMAIYDMPAMVDYVLNHTRHNQLYLIGHSTGGGFFPYVFLATLPDYNSKVKALFGLAPMGNYADQYNVLVQFAVKGEPLFRALGHLLGIGKINMLILPKWILGTIAKHFSWIADVLLIIIYGANNHMNSTRTPIYVTHLVGSSSFRAMDHLMQDSPPVYDLSPVTVRSYLYYGGHDILTKTNAEYLKDSSSGNCTVFSTADDWNHADFVLADNARSILYNRVMAIIANDANHA